MKEQNDEKKDQEVREEDSKVLKGAACAAGGAGVAAVAAPAAIVAGVNAVGFGTAGVTAGSVAAGLQGSSVVAGSAFAACQSIGATGSLAYLGAAAIVPIAGVAVVGGLAGLGGYLLYTKLSEQKEQQKADSKSTSTSASSGHAKEESPDPPSASVGEQVASPGALPLVERGDPERVEENHESSPSSSIGTSHPQRVREEDGQLIRVESFDGECLFDRLEPSQTPQLLSSFVCQLIQQSPNFSPECTLYRLVLPPDIEKRLGTAFKLAVKRCDPTLHTGVVNRIGGDGGIEVVGGFREVAPTMASRVIPLACATLSFVVGQYHLFQINQALGTLARQVDRLIQGERIDLFTRLKSQCAEVIEALCQDDEPRLRELEKKIANELERNLYRFNVERTRDAPIAEKIPLLMFYFGMVRAAAFHLRLLANRNQQGHTNSNCLPFQEAQRYLHELRDNLRNRKRHWWHLKDEAEEKAILEFNNWLQTMTQEPPSVCYVRVEGEGPTQRAHFLKPRAVGTPE